jgi:hypothetical protein
MEQFKKMWLSPHGYILFCTFASFPPFNAFSVLKSWVAWYVGTSIIVLVNEMWKFKILRCGCRFRNSEVQDYVEGLALVTRN